MVVIVLRKIKRLGNFALNDQGLGIAEVPFWFPSVLCCRISLSPDQEGAVTGLSPVPEDHFDLIHLFTIY